jgi:enamine deaminase RidA (YjgF/YER057c/UK114 family)
MITPRGRGTFCEQAHEALAVLRAVLAKRQPAPVVTAQTVFLRDARDRAEFERLLAEHFGREIPITSFILQPPCCGAALALEVWAIGGESVRIERFGPHAITVSYDGLRWVKCGGIAPPLETRGVYWQAIEGFRQMRAVLAQAGSDMEHAVRTWLYLGGITEREGELLRYQELNRARADFYHGFQFGRSIPVRNGRHSIYPASTGIGMQGDGLVMGCLALETERDDVFLLPLENPQQTPAYAYDASHSPRSPKFSRGMALVTGQYVTTWISGTASIVDSESRHAGDIAAQTEQTIDNIERLIAPTNFAEHGLNGTRTGLNDLAKVRVYLKRAEDFAACKAICERRLGTVPAIYVVADVCRPELLVEIEGVAFSKCAQ